MGINWRTAKKYADEDQVPQEKAIKRTGMMYEEKWGEIVSDWLTEDAKIKKKNRRTNKQILKDLKEIGFPGSYRTLCYFIKEWNEGRDKGVDEESQDKNYERLHHPPAEAQLDFGLMEAVKDGEYVDLHCLVMTLPYSNAAYCVPLPGENQECFLYGLKTMFKQLDGVPKKIRIDNLKAAVIKPRNRNEEAVFTDEFIQFANYYGFIPQACNPYSGHEKGNVENKVGYIRYNLVTPSPVMHDFQQLTQSLKESLSEDLNRIHYKKKVTLKELLEEEGSYLLELPKEDYPVFKEQTAKANKYGEIVIDKVSVHIPKGYNHAQLHVVKYWDKFKVASPYGEILYEDYRPYMQRKRAIPWKSIFQSWLRKPRVVTYSRYTPYLPGRIKEYLSIDNFSIRKDRLKWLIGLLAKYDLSEINDFFYELLSEQSTVLKEPDSHPYDVDWLKYDQLQAVSQSGGEAN